MRSYSLFIIANIILLLLCVLHLVGHFMGANITETTTETQLFFLINHLEINMLGIMRTYSDLLHGYSLIFAVTTLFFVIYNFSLINLIKENLPLYRNILLLNILLWGIELIIFIRYMVLPQIILGGSVMVIFLLSYFLLDNQPIVKR